MFKSKITMIKEVMDTSWNDQMSKFYVLDLISFSQHQK